MRKRNAYYFASVALCGSHFFPTCIKLYQYTYGRYSLNAYISYICWTGMKNCMYGRPVHSNSALLYPFSPLLHVCNVIKCSSKESSLTFFKQKVIFDWNISCRYLWNKINTFNDKLNDSHWHIVKSKKNMRYYRCLHSYILEYSDQQFLADSHLALFFQRQCWCR